MLISSKKRMKEEGITLVEVSVGLVIIALLAIFLAPRIGGLLGKTRVELAQQEITPIMMAAQQYRQANNGGYTGITISKLESDGYGIDPFSADNLKNVYGEDISLTATDTNKSATLKYGTDKAQECEQLVIRFTGLAPVTATCATTLLSLVIK